MIRAAGAGPGTFMERLRHFFLDPAGASVALEFSSVSVTAARIEARRGVVELRALVSEPLVEGALRPALDSPGFVAREQIRDAVKRVLHRVGAVAGAKTAIVVPDIVARFRLFPQSEVAAEPGRQASVVGFKLQKLMPTPPAETRVVAALPGNPNDPVLGIGYSTVVTGAYEEIGQAFGLDVGSVETSSMALLPLLPRRGDALLIRHDPVWLTLTLTRNGWPVAIRSFDAAVAASAEESRREIASTAVFYKDRLSGGTLDAALLHSTDAWFDVLSAEAAVHFGRAPERARPPQGLTVAGVPAAVERAAAPALALLAASN